MFVFIEIRNSVEKFSITPASISPLSHYHLQSFITLKRIINKYRQIKFKEKTWKTIERKESTPFLILSDTLVVSTFNSVRFFISSPNNHKMLKKISFFIGTYKWEIEMDKSRKLCVAPQPNKREKLWKKKCPIADWFVGNTFSKEISNECKGIFLFCTVFLFQFKLNACICFNPCSVSHFHKVFSLFFIFFSIPLFLIFSKFPSSLKLFLL